MASTQFAAGSKQQVSNVFRSSESRTSRSGQRNNYRLLIFQDLLTVTFTAVLSQFLFHALHRNTLPGFVGLGISFAGVAELLGIFFISLALVSYRMNLHRPDLLPSYLYEQRLTVQAALLAGLIASGALYILHASNVPRSLVLILIALSTTLLCSRRLVQRYVMHSRHAAGISNRHILIVGAEPEAGAIRSHIENLHHLGFAVKGQIELPIQAEPLGRELMEGIFEEARAKFVDEIFLVSPHQSGSAQQMLEWAREYEVDLRIVPDLYGGLAWNRGTEFVGQFPTIPLHQGSIPEFSLFLKHSLDLIVSLTGLAVCAIPMLIIALLIKLDSPGPVFYRSERVGRKGRIFKCTKFRTMVPNADQKLTELMHLNERDGVLFKISNDPRITRIGRFLRKYSVDELPQLFDVVRGDMSIVGPRPPIASEVRQYKHSHLRRLEVTPGITGLWQVQARRDPSFDSYVSLDLAYVENWSIWLDLKIMVRTIGVVLAGTGS